LCVESDSAAEQQYAAQKEESGGGIGKSARLHREIMVKGTPGNSVLN
jgi:hypothetical protein